MSNCSVMAAVIRAIEKVTLEYHFTEKFIFQMCSVGDDGFENEAEKVMTRKEKPILLEKCNKCRIAKSCVVLRNKDTYCKSCFLTGTTHKFKALLGKSCLVYPNYRILIYHKIGHPSTALLHFLRTGLDLNTPKKFRFEPIILFVEDIYTLNLEERRNILKKVEEEVISFGFKLHFLSFTEYVLNPSRISEIITCNNLQVSEDDQEKQWNVLDKKISKTNKNYIINLYKRQVLVDAAKYLNCQLIFTPEISIDTASHLLSNICLGRGCHVPIDTGFCDDRCEVKILRPLRLFDMKELALYNRFCNLEPIFIRQREVNQYSSVHDLMKKFVKDLQENYPATVTTIIRTGDKLTLDKNSTNVCKLCQGALQKQESELTSEESTKFSHLLSTKPQDYTISTQEEYQNVIQKFKKEINSNDDYCYACSKVSTCIKMI